MRKRLLNALMSDPDGWFGYLFAVLFFLLAIGQMLEIYYS